MRYSFIILFLLGKFTFAQDNSEKVVSVGYDACECIGKIDTDLDYEEKSKQIKECIKSANISYQMLTKLTAVNERLEDTISKPNNDKLIDSINIEQKEINITLDSDEDLDEIEDYLMETCGDMKSIYFSNDKKTSRKSVSKKEEARVYYSKGIQASQDQDYELAVEYYKKALAIDKKFAFAWDNLGIAYRKLNKNAEAVEAYKKSLKIDPKGKMPLMNIGIAYERLGQYDNAIKYYEKYKKLYKKDPEGYYGLGRMYFEKKDYEPAVDYMMQAYLLYIEIDSPYKQDAASNLGIMYNALKGLGKESIFVEAAKKNKIKLQN